jgi:hypothetical protein
LQVDDCRQVNCFGPGLLQVAGHFYFRATLAAQRSGPRQTNDLRIRLAG